MVGLTESGTVAISVVSSLVKIGRPQNHRWVHEDRHVEVQCFRAHQGLAIPGSLVFDAADVPERQSAVQASNTSKAILIEENVNCGPPAGFVLPLCT